jgi:hypothetical protein
VRADDSEELLAGYVIGPAAATEATSAALSRAVAARAVVLGRGKDEAAQFRRFLGAGSQRKLRYARLLTEAIDSDRMPHPLEAVLSAV